MTKVFTHGGAKVTHLEKGTFQVNTQRLKLYFGGEFHANKQTIPLNISEEVKYAVLGARVLEHIEIQGRQANDIKHSASWEATQVFLELFLSIVQLLLFVLILAWFSVFFNNRVFLLAVCFQGPRSRITWVTHSRKSLPKLKGITN